MMQVTEKVILDILKLHPYLLWKRIISYLFFEGRPAFSKARWLNLFVFLNFKAASILLRNANVYKPIFVVGMGRSGTTILSNLFYLHEHVGVLFEPKALWHEIYQHEDLQGSYTMGQSYYKLESHLVTPEISNRARRIYQHYLWCTGAKRVVEKYPEMIFRIRFVKGIFPDARFIYISRNGSEVIASTMYWSQKYKNRAKGHHYWWGINHKKWKLLCEQVVSTSNLLHDCLDAITKFSRDEDRAAVEWICTIEEGLKIQPLLGNDLHSVDYAELLNAPIQTMKRILDFCELPYSTQMFAIANRVLRPQSPKSRGALHPTIQQPFNQAMSLMGYSESQTKYENRN